MYNPSNPGIPQGGVRFDLHFDKHAQPLRTYGISQGFLSREEKAQLEILGL